MSSEVSLSLFLSLCRFEHRSRCGHCVWCTGRCGHHYCSDSRGSQEDGPIFVSAPATSQFCGKCMRLLC